MRKVIFIISFIFYLCAAVITYKATTISSRETVSTQESLSPVLPPIESIDKPSVSTKYIPEKLGNREFEDNEYGNKEFDEKEEMSTPDTEEQADDKVVIDELKSTIAKTEEKLSKSEEEDTMDNTVTQPEQTEMVIATVGGGVFSSGQDIINDELRTIVKDIVTKLMAFPEHRIKVEGHTDNLPVTATHSKRYHNNYELSFLRAKAVALLLEDYGISKERISIVGFGDTHPIAPNTTKEGRAQNRRVEVRIISPSK